MASEKTQRKKPAKTQKPSKPELFIGSSAEAVPLLNVVTQLLQHQFRVTPWTAGVFEPSSGTLVDLMRQVEKTAYGVFIFAKDDRVASRGKQYSATRDNVHFELGLFMGRLGPKNCFILVPKDRKNLKIPSDLDGFSPISYEDERLDDNPQAAFAAACATISTTVSQREKNAPPAPLDVAVALKPPPPPPLPVDARVRSALQDLLGMVHIGAAGVEVLQRDQEKFLRWAKNVLHMALLALRSVTPGLPEDAYVAWLRPTAKDRGQMIFFVGENAAVEFASAHHPFSLGEGLAGSVWSEGHSASHSPSAPHPKWRPRADCKNESYVCVPVGKAAGAGGVIGFGSNEGFQTDPGHTSVLEAFAALVAAVVPAEAWWGQVD